MTQSQVPRVPRKLEELVADDSATPQELVDILRHCAKTGTPFDSVLMNKLIQKLEPGVHSRISLMAIARGGLTKRMRRCDNVGAEEYRRVVEYLTPRRIS